MAAYARIPSGATLSIKPFTAQVSDEALQDLSTLIRLSKLGPETFENQVADVKDFRDWGITRDWLSKAKSHWETGYDWRKTQDRINSYPNFHAAIDQDGFTFDVHFVALFSERKDAVPISFLHGWPGSFLEFLGVLDLLTSKYSPAELPYHVVVPSLPGYAYSNGPSLEKTFDVQGIAAVIDKLMIGLGFGGGYVTQGGDVGSFVSRVLGAKHDACKAVHLNMSNGIRESEAVPVASLSPEEQKGLQRGVAFGTLGNAYAREHGSRPATIGLVLSSSPIALLAWIGEKFLQWSDKSPPLDEILDSVTLYWLTETFPRSIYIYRQLFGDKPNFFHNNPDYKIAKPTGYSWHPQELAPVPKDWVARTCNLVWYRNHDAGGHFAAMERPTAFVQDVEDFVKQVWPTIKNRSVL